MRDGRVDYENSSEALLGPGPSGYSWLMLIRTARYANPGQHNISLEQTARVIACRFAECGEKGTLVQKLHWEA